ncbi:MAG: HepT-like ribonuclease domain-containing protein [Phormidesmis sp.]
MPRPRSFLKRYTAGMTLATFIEDERTFEAVVFNLQVIGEASKNMPEDYRVAYSQIEWRKIVGLRNIIVHTYFTLTDEIIWSIPQNKLTSLRNCIQIMKNDL